MKIQSFIENCRRSHTPFLLAATKSLYYHLYGKKIWAHPRVSIRGISNIETRGLVKIGLRYAGFAHPSDLTWLNVQGELIFRENFKIGQGCRFDIGKEATVSFGTGYINNDSLFVIMHGLEVGNGCAISWGCQFLDDDFHQVTVDGQSKVLDNKIMLGRNVLIGSRSLILKGVNIAEGSVVAAGSIVTQSFLEPNVLIAGNPAKVVRSNVTWGNARKNNAI